MGVRLFCNRALVWCLAGIDYEMPELGSDGLRIALYVASPPYEALFQWRGRFRLGEWINLKRGVYRGGYSLIGLREYRIMLCGGVCLPSKESGGLETEVGHRANLVVLVWCLTGIDYKILELGSVNLVMGSRLCP
ncbi:hypothetical protein M9H77_13862 [Catharanthus roseus]|uniref:Uncharacterized protein n=1 Tax=Catharanthus roseus TaxID=4058 RepID=A0ACC0BLM8_CATRO|nr:hypothetical protein M9H77_13862 [Catharanthus roseus]